MIGASFVAGIFYGGKKDNTKVDSTILTNRLNSIRELSTLEYKYTKMVTYSNVKTFYGWEVPFTEKKFIITYNGSIKSGIDLNDVTVAVDNNKKEIKVNLPEAKILSHEIDEDSIKIFDEKNSIFNPLKVEDFKSFATDQKDSVEKEAIKKGLLTEAEKHSKDAILETFSIDGLLDDYKVIFE